MPDSNIYILKQHILFTDKTYYELARYFYNPKRKTYDTLIYNGSYSLEEEGGISYLLFSVHFIRRNTLDGKINSTFDSEIKLINDSTLKLFGQLHYKKAKSDALAEMNYPYTESSFNSFYVENAADSTRRISLEEEVQISVDAGKADSSIQFQTTRLVCHLDSVKQDSAFIRMSNEYIYTRFKDGSSSSKENKYTLLKKQATIDLKRINYVEVRTPFKNVMT